MRVVFFGSGEFAVPALRWLMKSRHEVAMVVTQPDKPGGRGKKSLPTPIASAASEHGLSVERCADVNEPQFVERIRSLGAELGVVIAFGQKLLEPIRTAMSKQCVNLHASLLPKYRGAAPIHGAMLAGESTTGVTVFRLVDRMDAGPMLVRREAPIGSAETCGELHDRLAELGCEAIEEALSMHEDQPLPPGEPQDESQATSTKKLSKSDGYLRFDEPAEQIALRCRAMWPWPGACCRYVSAEGKSVEVTVSLASALSVTSSEPPGTVTAGLTVATGAGTLEIHRLKPAGKRLMSWQDFVNGWRVKPQDRFEEGGKVGK